MRGGRSRQAAGAGSVFAARRRLYRDAARRVLGAGVGMFGGEPIAEPLGFTRVAEEQTTAAERSPAAVGAVVRTSG